MSTDPYSLMSEGTVVKVNDKIYWFKNDVWGQESSVPGVQAVVEGILSRKLNSFEFGLIISRPIDGSAQITIISAIEPSQNILKSIRTVVGYAVRRRENSGRFNYGDVIGTDGFYDVEGNLYGQVSLTRKQEPGLERPLIDPIDFIGGALSGVVVSGIKAIFARGAEEIAPEIVSLLTKAPVAKSGLRVLLVGPETEAEFSYARSIIAGGGKVTCVNPVKKAAADRFIAAGGEFVQGEVGSLPDQAVFDFIREDFPYPTGNYIDFAQTTARITRLKPGGAWVVVTEAEDFANTLEAAAEMKGAKVLKRIFAAAHEAAPISSHPKDSARFALIIMRK